MSDYYESEIEPLIGSDFFTKKEHISLKLEKVKFVFIILV